MGAALADEFTVYIRIDAGRVTSWPYYRTFIKLVRTGAPDFGERFGEVVG
jgi:hypothetical protein